MSTIQTAVSAYPEKWTSQPFFALTIEMLNCVRDHNFERLAEICDDDFGIVDINPEAGSEIIRDREGWENWFKGLFHRLSEMKAKTWSEITNYESLQAEKMGYCVVDFHQYLEHDGQKLRFPVIATIIWKLEDGVWKESRYHSSMTGDPEPY